MRINHQPAQNLVRNAGAEIPANDMQAEIDACCTSGVGQDLSFVESKRQRAASKRLLSVVSTPRPYRPLSAVLAINSAEDHLNPFQVLSEDEQT